MPWWRVRLLLFVVACCVTLLVIVGPVLGLVCIGVVVALGVSPGMSRVG